MTIPNIATFDHGTYQENFCDRQQRPGGFFDSWDRRTVALAFMLLLDATVGNLLLQEFSAPRWENVCQFLYTNDPLEMDLEVWWLIFFGVI